MSYYLYLQSQRKILISLLVVILCLSFPMLFIKKGNIVLWFNEYSTSSLTCFFQYFTYFGTAYFYFGPLLFFLIKRKYNLIIYFTVGFVVQAAFTLVLKYTFDADRPIVILQELYNLKPLGLYHNRAHSFPSGHTTTVFSLVVLTSLVISSKKLLVVLLLIAVLVGASRIYLIQHFFVDVYAGAVIGSGCALTTYFYFRRIGKIT